MNNKNTIIGNLYQSPQDHNLITYLITNIKEIDRYNNEYTFAFYGKNKTRIVKLIYNHKDFNNLFHKIS
jgi:hypothetical protein